MKDRILAALQRLPNETTVEEAMECLYMLDKVERGLADAQGGRTVSHEEIRRRFLGDATRGTNSV